MAHHHLPLAMAATFAAVGLTLLAPRSAGYPWPVCGDSSNFEPNSAYQANLDLLAATLPKNASASPDLYATAVVGAIPEQTWAMALCRGDTNASSCLSCLTQAFRDLPNDCTYDKDGTIYYDPCILHYSGVLIHSGNDTGPSGDLDSSYTIKNNANVTSNKSHQFNRHLSALMDAIADYAAYNSTRRFATGESDMDQELSITVYGMSQCTPEQTPTQCRSCLANIMAKSLDMWQDGIGGRWLSLNCTWRYETAPFFDGPVMVRLGLPTPSFAAPPPAPAAAQAGGSKHKKKVFIIVLLASIASLCAMLLGCLMLTTRLRKRAAKTKLQMQAHLPRGSKTKEALMLWRIEESTSGFTLYDFSELAAATGGFSDGNRLGRGGYGPVYKGTLTDGAEIAVKRLAAQSGQGLEEFKNEIQLIAKLQHNNLVRLLGCCVQEEDKMLVYEYLPNRSLDFFIFDQQQGSLLDWKKRMHIIEGIAQGLLYLHKHSRVRIIHRDLKASNILLDKDLNPKISDFGMARIFASNMTVANTNRVVGTYGYMAPEYASEGIFSVRSDVFSFGVLLLEIITGKRNSGNHQYGDFINLLGYAWQLWREGRASELIEPMLGDGNDVTSILRCVKVALLCVQDNAIDRPRMTEIIEMLGHDGAVLQDPKQPPHFHLRVTDDDDVRGRGREEGLEAQTQSRFIGSFSTNDLTITTIKGR